MQLLNISDKSLLSVSSTVSSDDLLNQKLKANQAKLFMVWVNEFDGQRNRLVAKWIRN
ncbi:hypothetical protein H6G76_32560 [Nostoc sp. FACHB-152]|uniref:hypothetical protein n=1 Tax=Nostoc sp. FACHB-152 TaxID=2692837 RepID=UPI0016877507|nr:hypothetical protein [Nostoc sp. FACHB-152]MBD2451771.1 hypothetical protein [Nostoc sp. FACHB-152]